MTSVFTSPLPQNYNFQIWTGSTFRQQITLTTISGIAIDLTGFTGACTIRTGPHQDPPLYEMTTQNGGIIIANPSTAGTFSLYIPASQTLLFTWAGGVYDLLLIDNNGNYAQPGDTIALLQGNFAVRGYGP